MLQAKLLIGRAKLAAIRGLYVKAGVELSGAAVIRVAGEEDCDRLSATDLRRAIQHFPLPHAHPFGLSCGAVRLPPADLSLSAITLCRGPRAVKEWVA